MDSKTFKGEEIYSMIQVADTRLPYKAGSKLEGQHYHVGRWGSLGFTCSEAFYKELSKQNGAQVTLTPSSYERTGIGGEKETVQSATLNGYVTFDGKINLVEKIGKLEVAIAKSEVSVKHARLVAISDLSLPEVEMNKLLAMA